MPTTLTAVSSSKTAARRPTVEAITRVLDRLATTREATLPDGRVRSIDPFAVTSAAGQVLEHAAQAAPPGPVIEVGCASGMSTLHISRGRLSAGLLDGPSGLRAIDPKQTTHWDSIGRMHLQQAGLGDVVSIDERPAHAVLPELLAQGLRVSFAFLDGWHMLDYAMIESFYVDLMLDVGGVIALHDLWMPGLQQFACFWLTNREYEAVTIGFKDSGGPHLVPVPCESTHREVGDLLHTPRIFTDRVLPFVDHSVLLMRKRDDDRRKWDDFWPYTGA